MTVTGTRAMPRLPRLPRLRHARFDPRLVVVGFVLLAAGTFTGYWTAGTAANKADEVAAPVSALCQQGGQTGAHLASTGACKAAGETSVGPFKSDVATGAAGATGATGATGQTGATGAPGTPGEPGTQGAPGTPGTPGTPGPPGAPGADGTNGTDGIDGINGVSPACLSEPGQCRGADGAPGKDGAPGRDGVDGKDGATGPPGPTCPDGSTLQPVMFASGQEGLGCVTTGSDDSTEPTG